MTSSIFQIGLSGLNAAQYDLTTTSENISNASTPGYDTESVQVAESDGQFTGGGFLGTGVDVTTVTRAYSQYLTQQLNQATSTSGSLTAQSSNLTNLNDVFGNPTAGLTSSLDGFFSSLQSVASDPSSTATRQAFLGDAQTLTTQINTAADNLQAIGTQVNGQITSTVASINTYAQQIASLNTAIESATATGGTAQPPNNLLDQRDQAVASLSQLVGTTVVPVSGGGVNVYIGQGQSLVLGSNAYALQTEADPNDPTQLSIAYSPPGGTTSTDTDSTITLPTSSLSGGTLGGLLTFNQHSLLPAQQSLDTLAATLAGAVNAQNQLGVTSTGQAGQALFTTVTPTVVPASTNTGTAEVSVGVEDAAAPPADQYTLSYNGSGYVLVDQTTGTIATFTPTASFPISEFGLSINVSGTPKAGDSFTLSPTRGAAAALSLSATSPGQVAAAAPILATASVANQGTGTVDEGTVSSAYLSKTLTTALSSNAGTGTIAVPSADDDVDNALTAPFTLTADGAGGVSGFPAGSTVSVTANGTTTAYDTATSPTVPWTAGATYSVQGASFQLNGTPAAGDQFVVQPNAPLTTPVTLTAAVSGGVTTVSGFPANDVVTATTTSADGSTVSTTYAPPTVALPYDGGATTYSFGGASITLNGTPSNGDTFTVAPNAGTADGRNAQALADLASTPLLNGGTQSIAEAYSTLVSQIGSQATNVTAASTSAQALLTQFTTEQQSVSGVNLDQEAANLLQYQQLYEANSKVIQIASSLFDTILQLN